MTCGRASEAAQDGHRVDARGSTRRDLSRQQGHRPEKRHHRCENQRSGIAGDLIPV
jgi:hypothetical protein